MTRPGIEPRSPRPLANTLPTRPAVNKLIIDKTTFLFIVDHSNYRKYYGISKYWGKNYGMIFAVKEKCFASYPLLVYLLLKKNKWKYSKYANSIIFAKSSSLFSHFIKS